MFTFYQQTFYVSSGTPETNHQASGSIRQLSRVQSVTVDLQSPRTEFSYLNEQVENSLVLRPRIPFNFEYFVTAGLNERNLGLVTDGYHSAFWLLNREKDYFIQLENEHVDANFPNNSPKTVLGIGNALLNGYSIAASVGGLVRVTCSAEGLNINSYTGSTNQLSPAVDHATAELLTGLFTLPPADSQISNFSANTANDIRALGAKDLLLEFPSGSVFATSISGDGCILQNFNLSFSIDRNESISLGEAYPSERRINPPIHVQLSCDAVMNNFNVAQLRALHCPDSGHDINILIKQPCSDELAIEFLLRGMKLESQNFGSTMDALNTVSFNWVGVVGDLNNSGQNVFINAHYGTIYYFMTSLEIISGVDVNGDFAAFEKVTFQRGGLSEHQFFSGQV